MLRDSVVVEERVKANIQEIADRLKLDFNFRLFHGFSIGLGHQRIEEGPSQGRVVEWGVVFRSYDGVTRAAPK